MFDDFINRLTGQEQGCAEKWLRCARVTLTTKNPSESVEEAGIRGLDLKSAKGETFSVPKLLATKSELVGDGIEDLGVAWTSCKRGLKAASRSSRVAVGEGPEANELMVFRRPVGRSAEYDQGDEQRTHSGDADNLPGTLCHEAGSDKKAHGQAAEVPCLCNPGDDGSKDQREEDEETKAEA